MLARQNVYETVTFLVPARLGRAVLTTLVGIAWTAGSLALGVQTDVTGQWEVTLRTQVGESTWIVTFEQEGGALSGQVDIGDREVFPLDGTIDGAAIEFVFVMPDLDGDQPIMLSGTVDGDTIAGDDGSFSWFGTGNWTGTRQAS